MTQNTEYLNMNFTSFDDLDTLDSKINELETLKSKVAVAVNRKLKNDGNAIAVDADEPKEVNEETAAYVQSLIGEIGSITRQSITSQPNGAVIQQIDQLIAKHGALSVLLKLKLVYDEKVKQESAVGFLVKARDVEEKMTALDVDQQSGEFELLHRAAKELKSHDIASDYNGVIEQIDTALHAKIEERKDILTSRLSSKLSQIHWLAPKSKNQVPSSPDLKEILSMFNSLLELQNIDNKPTYPDTWWAFEVLLQPFVTRFNYHFQDRNKETNKLSKPEWALNYIESFLSDEAPLVELVFGGVLENVAGRITTYEIITAILKPLRDKIFRMVEILNDSILKYREQEIMLEKSGRVLSHLIFELTSFDQRLRNQFRYNPYVDGFDHAPSKKWLGLTGDILLHNETEKAAVTNWLNFEYQLGKKRFDSEIIGPSNAFDIDMDYHSDQPKDNQHLLKPTYSAFNLTKLFNNLTGHYKTLSIVKYQLKYVSNIQLKFVDEYLDTVNKKFKRFGDSLNSQSLLGFIPGGRADNNNVKTLNSDIVANGLKALEILTGLYCSTKFINDSLNDWSEELIFIQLWNTYQSIAGSTDGSTIFDYSIKQSSILATQIITKYADFFRREIKTSLKDYVNSTQWNVRSISGNMEPSTQISSLINNLPVYLGYLRKCVSSVDYYIVSDKVVTTLTSILYEYVVTNNQFTKHGVEQLRLDFNFIIDRLNEDLLVRKEKHHQYTNANNKQYLKLLHSIDFLQHIDPLTAEEVKRDANKTALRSRFDHRLEHLKDHEINDLLYRII